MKILVKFFVLMMLAINAYAQNVTSTFDYQKKTNYSDQVVSTKEVDSLVILQKIVIDGFDSKIPFYHFQNKRNIEGQYIILLHGLGGSKEDWIYPSMPYLQWSRDLAAIKDSLLTLGYNILIPDAKYHGERSYELNFRPAEQLPPIRSRNQEDGKIFNIMMSNNVKDIRIIMDFIERENKEKKPVFSLVGYSMGGATAILLNASDNRIVSVVACVPPLNHPEKEVANFKWPREIVRKLAKVTPKNYSRLQQSPILLLMGEQDFFYTKEEVNSFYEGVSIKEKKVKYFESGHILPEAYVNEVITWVTKYNN
ncbi:MAG TPA: alpha/beta fold hydrolase [Gracilimonas sp.]|uniref:alpha/beta hydrolase n=1 Tax=Gracilimonas sp. TaxID=1974203 RepID=UPI002DAE1573|nr:alpha/beta fold hydrolase [Gracilimonas sp.]